MRELGRRRFLMPVLDLDRVRGATRGYARFVRDLRRYRALGGSAPRDELFPQLHDRTAVSSYDAHYFNQDVWAARCIAELAPRRHVDVGSRVDYVGFLTAITKVTFVDIRPLEATIENLTSIAGSALALPFQTGSLESVSCLHVAEHIGLGRYGDPLDPDGTAKAARELARVLAPGGQLLFSLPVGRERTCFNAHRIHAPARVRELFADLELAEFAGVDDRGRFARYRALEELADEGYGCGFFRLVRPSEVQATS